MQITPYSPLAKVRIGKTTMQKTVAIDMMAREIINCAETGQVHSADFLKLGFNASQIAAWAGDAYRRALQECPGIAAQLEAAA